MTSKRRRFILSAAIVTMVAVASFWLITFLNREESLFWKSKRIQIGMTADQVEAIIGRPSDPSASNAPTPSVWFPESWSEGARFPPSGSAGGDYLYIWSDEDGILVVLIEEKNETVTAKEFYPYDGLKVNIKAFFGL